jgi:hypothetical protein
VGAAIVKGKMKPNRRHQAPTKNLTRYTDPEPDGG